MSLITCPNCAAKYSIGTASLPPGGRTVRCARCRNIWQAITIQGELDILPPRQRVDRPVEPNGPEERAGAHLVADDNRLDEALVEGAANSAEPSVRARLAAAAATGPRRRGGAIPLQAIVLGLSLALGGSAGYYRTDIVRAVPSASGLFGLVGLPVNLRGLEFKDVSPKRVFEDGLPVLIVEGEIVNLRAETTPVPALRFALRGRGEAELYTWNVEPRQTILDAGASMSFRTRLAAPPQGAEEIQLRFAERSRRVVVIEQ